MFLVTTNKLCLCKLLDAKFFFFVTKTFCDEDKATFIKRKYFRNEYVFVTKLNFLQQYNFVTIYHISCSVSSPKDQTLIWQANEKNSIVIIPKPIPWECLTQSKE